MEPGSLPHYQLDAMPSTLRQLRDLSKRASELGLAQRLIDTLKEMTSKLRIEPEAWGDPEYHPRKQGSCVYHRACDPLFVKYVVFEAERRVLVLEIKALSSSLLG